MTQKKREKRWTKNMVAEIKKKKGKTKLKKIS